MTNLEITRRFWRMTAKAMAEALSVSPQQLNGWLNGTRTPSRSTAGEMAEILEVDPAWILGEPQRFPLWDPLAHTTTMCDIMRTEEIEGYGALFIVNHPDVGLVAVIQSAGIQFTPTDWQGEQPRTTDDIASTAWMTPAGTDAIMLDGLPRMLA